MGGLVQMAVTGQMAKSQYKVTGAMQGAEKTIGSAEIDVQNLLNETQASIQNALRGENNTLLAARAALGNFQKSAKSEAILKAAGSKANAMSTNIARIGERNTANTLERRIQAAEQQGAATAAFAATGTGGASQRMLKTTLAATMARRETRQEDANTKQSYEMLAQRAGVMPSAVTQLDQGQVFVAVDHTTTVAPKVITPMWQADFQPSKETYVLNAVAGLAGNAIGSIWGKSQTGGGQQQLGKDGWGAAGSSDWWDQNSSDLSTSSGKSSYLASFDRDGGYYGRDNGAYSLGGGVGDE